LNARPEVPFVSARPTEFDHHTLILLRRPPDAPELTDAEADELQEAHLRFHRDLRERGLLAINGPVLDQPDGSLRGLCLYRVPPAEAAALAAGDPLVERGRLVVEAMTWMVPAGIMRV
jgi:uncharacterized protein YciI